MSSVLTIILVRLLNPILGRYFSSKSSYALTAEEINRIRNQSYPKYYEIFYILQVFSFIGILCLVSIYMVDYFKLFAQNYTFMYKGPQGLAIYEGITYILFPILLMTFIVILVTFSIPYPFSSSKYIDYLTHSSMKNGWFLSIRGQLLFTIYLTLTTFLLFAAFVLIDLFILRPIFS